MNRIIKRAISLVTTLIMVSSIAVNASAVTSPSYSWSLTSKTSPGAPTNANRMSISETRTNEYNGTIHYFTSDCKSFSSNENNNGETARVRYWTYIVDVDNKTVIGGMAAKYHMKSGSSTKTNLNVDFKYGMYAHVEYRLDEPASGAVLASMSGTYQFSS